MIQTTRNKVLLKYVDRHIRYDVFNFIKWMVLAVLTGLVVGGASSVFAECIVWVSAYRTTHKMIFLLLPLAGILIVFLYEKYGRWNQSGSGNHQVKRLYSVNLCATYFSIHIVDASDRRKCGKRGRFHSVWGKHWKFFKPACKTR